MHVLVALVVLGSGVMVIGVAAALAQGGFYLATKSVKPKLSKLDPIKGVKRIFGPQALWEGAKMLLKSAVVGIVVYTAIKGDDAADRRAGADPASCSRWSPTTCSA